MRRFAVVVILVGCGGPSSEPPINAPIAIASVTPSAPVVVKKAAPDLTTRAPSRELVRRWPLKDSAYVVIYADFGGFAATEVGRATGKQMASAFKSADAAKCFAGVLSMKELAFGVDDVGGLIVARFDKDPTADLETCMSAVESDYVPTTSFKGATKAWSRSNGSNEALVVDGKFVIFGTTELIERSLKSEGPDDGVLASMHIAADQFVMWQGHERSFECHGTLAANKEHLFANGEIDFQTEDEARDMEQRESPATVAHEIGASMEQFDKNAWRIVNRIAHDVTMRREPEKHVTIAFEAMGTADEQAKDVGDFGGLAVRALEHELARKRLDAARNGIWEIESALRTSLDGAKQKKLVSFAPVPKTVPKGTKVKLTEADWKAWSSIGIKHEGLQRFQFEVKASKAGDSAEILARGDLDGNGKTSLFKMKVNIDPSGALSSTSNIEETDPDE